MFKSLIEMLAMDQSSFSTINTDKISLYCGWNEALSRETFSTFPEPETFNFQGELATYEGTRVMLWEIVRKLLGKDLINYPQLVGDCVSFMAKNAIEYTQVYDIAVNKALSDWKLVYTPYLYGTGRVLVGGGQIRGDGSIGSWQASAVVKYGTIPSDTEGCPKYSGVIARTWGKSGPPKKFVDLGVNHLVKSTAMARTWEDCLKALANGWPVGICSNVGYSMRAGADGFHRQTDRWPHAMTVVGIDDGGDGVEPHACVLNSWGDAHGEITDFRTKEKWPVGTLRVRKSDLMKHLNAQDSYIYAGLNGFNPRQLDSNFFSTF